MDAISKTLCSRAALRVPIALFLVFGLVLSACSYARVSADFPQEAKRMKPDTFECCFDPEKFYPAPLMYIGLGLANTFGPTLSEALYGNYEETTYPGLLAGKGDAHAAILAKLKPLDILLVSNHSYIAGRMMVGRFSHSLVYIGTESQLRAAGLWNRPALLPFHDDIRAGKTLIEATSPDVHLIAPHKAFETDQVLALRPSLASEDRPMVLDKLMSIMGKPFNYQFGIDPNGERFSCTGVVAYAMPGLGFTYRKVYGQTVVMPDDVAAQAVRGEGLTPLIYVAGTEDGYAKRSIYALMVEIAAYWGIPPEVE